MNKQRGIADGWLYLIGVVVVLGLITALFYGVKSYLDGVDAKAYARGKKETEAAYAERDNEALRKANVRIKDLEERARDLENKHAVKLAAIAAERAKEKADAQKQNDADRNAVRSGTIQLRDPGATCTAPGSGRPGAQAATGAGGGDGKAGGQLSDAAAEFLLGLVNEADDVARQLASAQQVIAEQIATCNAP